MPASEAKIKAELLLNAHVDPNVRLFNCPTGVGYTGQVLRLRDGSVLIRNPRVITFGLCKGGSDLIGWKSIIVTAGMVGRLIAVFTAIETKTLTGRATAEQTKFQRVVALAGGIARLARNTDVDLEV